MMRRVAAFLRARFAVIIVAGAFVWSACFIFMHRVEAEPPGTAVIRLGHWQLEPGVRDAFNVFARRYEALCAERGQKVRIVQDPIPESTYGQWMVTQLMGGTAPDLIECALGVPYPVLLGYYGRHFVPMTPHISKPNPYNAGTEFEQAPWRATYKDAMRTSYVEELQEFMTIPLSQFGMRVFFNRNLLRRLTGREEPPSDFREFLDLCRVIGSQTNAAGNAYIPIAGSQYHSSMWDSYIAMPFTFPNVRVSDFDRDGQVGQDEMYVSIATRRTDFLARPFETRFAISRYLRTCFQPGFTGLLRDDGVFLFIQQRAVFIATGTWDQGSLREQAKGEFEVGICDFPRPTPSDPEFGREVLGPLYERPMTGFMFGITRFSKHPEIALDFLQYLSSQKINEAFNDYIGWIPTIQNTSIRPELKAFQPHLEGVYAAMPLELGGETIIKWQQLYALFQIQQLDFQPMMEQFGAFYRAKGPEEYQEVRRNGRRPLARDEHFIAGMRARVLMPDLSQQPEISKPTAAKYRQLVGARLIGREIRPSLLGRMLKAGEEPHAVPPYSLRPEVLEKVRRRVEAEARGSTPAPARPETPAPLAEP